MRLALFLDARKATFVSNLNPEASKLSTVRNEAEIFAPVSGFQISYST